VIVFYRFFMSLIHKFDILGYIYTFEYYLYEKKLDYSLIDFMENNNIDYFYVCFFDIIRDNTHYLVTTDPTNDLHQLITIKVNNAQNENNIATNDHQVTIHYNDYMIVTSNKMTLDKIEELVNFTQEEVFEYDKTYGNAWSMADKDWTLDLKTKTVSCKIYVHTLTDTGNIYNLRILSLSRISNALVINNINYIININISDFNMSKLFPYLQTITTREKMKIIYSRN
jgi:hypothetical protein